MSIFQAYAETSRIWFFGLGYIAGVLSAAFVFVLWAKKVISDSKYQLLKKAS